MCNIGSLAFNNTMNVPTFRNFLQKKLATGARSLYKDLYLSFIKKAKFFKNRRHSKLYSVKNYPYRNRILNFFIPA